MEHMGKVKYFFKNITLLNLLLLIIIIFIATYLLQPFFNMQVTFSLPRQKAHSGTTEITQDRSSPLNPIDYLIISDENLFHPERKIPPEKKVEQELPKPEFVLYGTMVSDDISVAFLEDLKAPRSTPGRGKRQVALKKGDMFSGFLLKEVHQDRIELVRGEEKMVIPVLISKNPKTRDSRATAGQKTPDQPRQKSQPVLQTPTRTEQKPPEVIPPAKPTRQAPKGAVLSDVDERMRLLFEKK